MGRVIDSVKTFIHYQLTMAQSDLDPKDQQQILKDFKDNPEVFEKVYEFYYEMIIKYLAKRTMSSEVAYDLTAETFIKAFESFGNFKWTGVSIKVWLYRIAINALKNYRRNPEYAPLNETLEGHEALVEDIREELKEMDKTLFGDDELAKLSDAIGTLKPSQQDVVTLYYFDEMSQNDIAKAIGKSVSSVKSLMHRAVTQLRQILAPNLSI
ncbi:sigma-70 family RNA polymerase sigma factor [Candidatus Peregrinibacteria bacterium]|nr:sigma-70 family RNA polymerase sigma factor [Candidatus Peregrinibacteria bacterium]